MAGGLHVFWKLMKTVKKYLSLLCLHVWPLTYIQISTHPDIPIGD